MDNLTKIEKLIIEIDIESNLSIAGSILNGSDLTEEEKRELAEWGARFSDNSEFLPERFDMTAGSRIDFAREHMVCLNALKEKTKREKPELFMGTRIAMNLIMEIKTACLALALRELGAEVSVVCRAEYVNDEAANTLREQGIPVYANSRNSAAEDRANFFAIYDEQKPEYIVDDGAHFIEALLGAGREVNVFGIAEETTSGVDAFRAIEKEGRLPAPTIAVNDAKIKTQFDNVHGTSETVIAAILKHGGKSFAGANVTLAGYGPVGFGIAKRLRALGAKVRVAEKSNVAALRALHDGFEIVSIEEAAPSADFIVTASGAFGTVTEAALAKAKDGCIVASAGGTDGEIADWREHKNVRVLTGGLGVNYTGEGAEGNPIEIMDLSFAAQFSALKYLIKNKGNLPRKVIELPEEISEKIAGERLRK